MSNKTSIIINTEAAQRHGLTPKQIEVFGLMANGYSNESIAATMRISVKTAEAHRARLFRRLSSHNAIHAGMTAVALGILVPRIEHEAEPLQLEPQPAETATNDAA